MNLGVFICVVDILLTLPIVLFGSGEAEEVERNAG